MWSSIITIFTKWVLRLALALLLDRLDIQKLLGFIREAETLKSTNAEKYAYVKTLLSQKDTGLSEHTVNAAIEVGVSLFKLIHKGR